MTDFDFKNYSENRKLFYDKLADFKIQSESISDGIKLNKIFFDRINNEFQFFLERRKTKIRLSKNESINYKNQFNNLDEQIIEILNYKGPAIYWFRINHIGKFSNNKILNRFLSVKKRQSGWWSKASKNTGNETEYLYVGKVEKNLHDRFIQHIGLGHKMTSSLKLSQWFSSLDQTELTFHFIKIDVDYINHLEDIENVIWRKLNPLLGAEPRIKENIS